MSSPGHHSYSVPPPRTESPGTASSAGGHGPYSSGTPPREGVLASSSRRASQASIQHSPTSQQRLGNYGTRGQSQTDSWKGANENGNSGHGQGGSLSGSAKQQHQQQQPVRLPRITTVNVDAPQSGPQSAPLRPNQSRNLMPNGSENGNGPIRSSSTPDPWLDRSPRESPSGSPIENRPNPVLGPPQSSSRGPSPVGSSRNPLPPLAIPPRRSSQIDKVGGMSTASSSQSLSDTDLSTPTNITPLAFPVPQTRSSKRGEPTYCGQCGQVVHGQFVRAMGHVYHLGCFRCKDCNKVVAQKFFPVEEGDSMYPLCETDYFARLDLICAKCGQALRSSYITACGEKYHVEHFTCSECETLFGPNDSYYEHGGKVYCHFHYSTKFAVKCVGCETAILKQFVEMNRNGRDECWHPECYMISKFWNVRLASKNFNTPSNSAVNSTVSLLEITPANPPGGDNQLSTSPASEISITPAELKDRQEKMEVKVQQIWHVLSGYEESSAALIGEMLRAVNGQQLLEIILLAEKFILHVEVLFAVVDDLEAQFALAGAKGMSHAREAKQLCRKLVNLFSMMSQIAPGNESPINTTELFTLITQLAHYLKILIRIALTGSIKLERDFGNTTAMANALARLNLLAMDNSDPTVSKRGNHGAEPSLKPIQANIEHVSGGTGDEEQLRRNIDALTRRPKGYISSTQELAYGYRSLAPEVTGETTLRGPQDESFIPPEGCAHCQLAMEEDCIRYGMFNRWHSGCVICIVCGDRALVPYEEEEPAKAPSDEGSLVPTKVVRRQPPRVDEFCFEPPQPAGKPPSTVYCVPHRTNSSVKGFDSVSRLEQYAFLLHIALRRLYIHYRAHHQLPSVRGRHIEDPPEVKRMKSVTLDRKLSSTARLPQRSMVLESPAGRIANEDGQMSARSNTFLSPRAVPSPSPDIRIDPDEAAATVETIRPPFARNNTSVMIIKEGQVSGPDDQASEMLATTTITPEDDAITLGDIPHLADQAIRVSSGTDGRPLLSTLNPLQSLIIRHFALLQLQKSGIGHLIELDDVLELLEARKSQWWNKIFKNNAKKDTKKKGVFGVPLEILVERTGSDSQQGASNAQLRVPEIIEDIISTMRQMDMAVEGIFRKNGNIRRLQQISDALDKDSTTVNLSEENPVQLAALLKRFLREMPDPLLTFRLHKLFCAAASLKNPEERRRCLHLLVVLLPRSNRDTLEVLFVFLKWVASFSYRDEETGSRMDMPNLATVICPSILYAKGTNAAKDESFIGIQAVQELLEEQDEFYHVPNELGFVISENIFNIFAKDLDLPPKEIHRHCSKYMQARGHQRIPPSTSASQVRDRDRPSDTRLGVHRSEGNLHGEMNGTPFRAPAPPGSNNSSRPTSWIQGQHNQFGSQQSLSHSALQSPAGTPWRTGGGGGPFQGQGNGSRQSSRGSAPSSPGPDHEREPRRSFNMDRERSRTPVQVEHR